MAISLPPDAHKLFFDIKAKGGDKKAIPVEPEWPGENLAVLLNKKTAERKGAARGPAARTHPGTVRLLVKEEEIELGPEIKRRAPRKGSRTEPTRTPRPPGVLKIEALRTFVDDFEDAREKQIALTSKELDAQVKQAREAVANATSDDDLQNATAMLSAALSGKRDSKRRAEQAVVQTFLKDETVVTLAPVLRMMLDPSIG